MSYRFPRLLPLFLLSLAPFCVSASSPRQDTTLDDGWKFIREDAGLGAPTSGWQSVTIPHTWNTKAADAGDHKGDPHYQYGYYRGACWYAHPLDIPADWQGKRVFIRFEAASLIARTWINGHPLGEHRGGFTAFCYELTPWLHFGGANELWVQVDNSHQEDVPPLSGDFNVDGGIYRPVHLIVTNPFCISPLDMASPGVYLTIRALGQSDAEVEVKTMVSNGGASADGIMMVTRVSDAAGKVVTSGTQPAAVASGSTAPIFSTLSIPSPHLWDGRKDPYLYTATVALQRNGNTLDSIQQPLGLRTVAISAEKGFLLNGRPYPVHGVNRHQDWGGQGWAATTANYDEDARLILDMGTTAIRLTHYPQSDYWHNLCDHNGLLLWNEVSLVNEVRNTPEFAANAEQQLRELILQRYNHPSVAFWGLFNELGLKKTVQPDALLQRLKTVINELDTSRLIVCAIAPGHKSYNLIPDHPCFNRYPGWYVKFGTLEKMIQDGAHEVGKSIGMSEYGAGANISQHEEGPLHQPSASGPYHPEEWQTYVHEADYAGMKDNPLIWGTFLWVMFDFQVSGRHEGSQPALNDKGLVTQDRKTLKDAYYFYQANWSEKPMVHIASKRMTPRRLSTTQVEVLSNCPKVNLSVNGKSLGTVTPDGVKVFRWPNVTLASGRNQVVATASSDQGEITDTCEWVLDPAAAPTPWPSPAPRPPKPSRTPPVTP